MSLRNWRRLVFACRWAAYVLIAFAAWPLDLWRFLLVYVGVVVHASMFAAQKLDRANVPTKDWT